MGFSATFVHILLFIEAGNLAPGNNLVRPLLLIAFLIAARREAAKPKSEAILLEFDQWRGPLDPADGMVTSVVELGFGIGYGFGRPVLFTILGILIGAGILVRVNYRSPVHKFR